MTPERSRTADGTAASAAPSVFFDRDGTLMKEVEYCADPSQVETLPGLAAKLQKLREAGFRRVIITNQSGIGRGYFTEEDFHAVQKELLRQLHHEVDAVEYCPDAAPSPRRKPAPQMIFDAARRLHLDLSRSFMVGDRASDIDAGKAAGTQTILVLTGYGRQNVGCRPDHIVPDVLTAIDLILTLHARQAHRPAVG